MQLGSMFISTCNNALHVSDAFCVHPQEHLETVVAASGVRKPTTLDALIGYFILSVSNINLHTHCISLYYHWYSPILIISSKQ